ncbi:hypothetical protein Skr01_55890 [Sphaerisporangium krabiense]|uniref:Uncharacterized protein n=1 Tax=Sphaerisporangium krabiense TaxID=763782 RepID=A0A7W8ZB83_9ACTN|nr:hypothetical protein [Sphaerisporangium krabiense]GII65504.1 hypothetical protein Skr01_55890 [Sphaerisporangium krabiense]
MWHYATLDVSSMKISFMSSRLGHGLMTILFEPLPPDESDRQLRPRDAQQARPLAEPLTRPIPHPIAPRRTGTLPGDVS